MAAITFLLLTSFFPSAAAAQPLAMAPSNDAQQSRVPNSYTPLVVKAMVQTMAGNSSKPAANSSPNVPK